MKSTKEANATLMSLNSNLSNIWTPNLEEYHLQSLKKISKKKFKILSSVQKTILIIKDSIKSKNQNKNAPLFTSLMIKIKHKQITLLQ